MRSTIKATYKTIDLRNPSYTIQGSARTYALFGYPNDFKKALAATLVMTPNADWLSAKILMKSDGVYVYMHNEYNGALSGELRVRLLYI